MCNIIALQTFILNQIALNVAIKVHHFNSHYIFKIVVVWDTLPCMFFLKVETTGSSKMLIPNDTVS
jgi:hypothetical protein